MARCGKCNNLRGGGRQLKVPLKAFKCRPEIYNQQSHFRLVRWAWGIPCGERVKRKGEKKQVREKLPFIFSISLHLFTEPQLTNICTIAMAAVQCTTIETHGDAIPTMDLTISRNNPTPPPDFYAYHNPHGHRDDEQVQDQDHHQHHQRPARAPGEKKPFLARVCTTNRRPHTTHTCSMSTSTTGVTLLHRLHHSRSILSLALNGAHIFAGSQSGSILVWSLATYSLVATLRGHSGSVLSLHLSDRLLFSSAGDAIVQVWCTQTLKNLYTIYSTFDVGDVFCVAYEPKARTAYFGAQNTSVQWIDLKAVAKCVTGEAHPSKRVHRFFDSKGPGGRSTPRPEGDDGGDDSGAGKTLLEIEPVNIVQYAHFGYVYCMLVLSASHIGLGSSSLLLTGGGDGDVKLWAIDPVTGGISELRTLAGGDSGVLSMVVKDTLLYTGLTDGEIHIWDLDTCQKVRSVQAHCDDVLTLAVKGEYIFSGSASGFTRKWNMRFKCVSRWRAHEGLVLASAVAERNGRLLYITGGNDDCVGVWDVEPFPAKASTKEEKGEGEGELLSSLAKLVAFRTVSSDPNCAEECRRGAAFLKSLCKRFGATASLLPTDGGRNPVVFARFEGAKKKGGKGKTLLFYGHYDVIPASSEGSGWKTDPFSLTGVDGYLYGRGVSDNKGPCLAALFAAGGLLQSGKLKSDIVFLIEGEEESGSRGFKDTVKKHKDLIGDVDWILFANSYWLDDDTPCLTYGLRGVIHATITIQSEKPDLHSGVDGSSLNRQPTIELITLLSRLTSPTGEILLPNFSASIRPVSPSEEGMYLPISASLHANPTSPFHGLPQQEITAYLMSKWRYPSLTIHRVDVSGPSNNSTLIPRSASATISLRIVPDQSVSAVTFSLHTHLASSYPGSNSLSIDISHSAEPWLGDISNDAFSSLRRAIVRIWGTQPLFIREGGSIPMARLLEEEFGAPAAHLPCGQASDMAHLDNERLRVKNLFGARDVLGRVFEELTAGNGNGAVSGKATNGVNGVNGENE